MVFSIDSDDFLPLQSGSGVGFLLICECRTLSKTCLLTKIILPLDCSAHIASCHRPRPHPDIFLSLGSQSLWIQSIKKQGPSEPHVLELLIWKITLASRGFHLLVSFLFCLMYNASISWPLWHLTLLHTLKLQELKMKQKQLCP